jgi:hypothetical protein
MANIKRNFIAGRMNKSLDERLLPNGEYVDALNVRLGSTEDSEIGSVENSKGNIPLTSIQFIDGTTLTANAKCIGAFQDGANNTVYWFIHDSSFVQGDTGKLDLIVSYNATTSTTTYHVISIDDGGGVNTTLNFNPSYLITGVNLIDNSLLFFTDNYNPPRFLNINKNYPNPILVTPTPAPVPVPATPVPVPIPTPVPVPIPTPVPVPVPTPVGCSCITVDVENTQLTSGGLDLYYILNQCGSGATDINLTITLGTESGGSTYFGFCNTGSQSNIFKYGPSGSPFVGLPGMNVNPNATSCSVNGDCLPVLPTP